METVAFDRPTGGMQEMNASSASFLKFQASVLKGIS